MTHVVIDIEATCCDDGSIPDDERETIEIGSVMLDEEFRTIGEFSALLKPEWNRKLTPFCVKLTGITQDMVDSAQPFERVWNVFSDWIDLHDVQAIYSWGRWDVDELVKEFRRGTNGIVLPINWTANRCIDLAAVFRRKTGRRRGHNGALRYFGLDREGPMHRALPDARNIARILPLLLGDQPCQPAPSPAAT